MPTYYYKGCVKKRMIKFNKMRMVYLLIGIIYGIQLFSSVNIILADEWNLEDETPKVEWGLEEQSVKYAEVRKNRFTRTLMEN